MSLGLALAGGCRSPDALAATPTDTNVTLTDWQAGTDLTNFQHPRPHQYLAVPNIIATANQQASTQTPSSAAIRPDQSVLPQTNEARQLLAWLGLLTAGLTGWLVWLMQRRRE
ncbi:cell surface protein precursor [Lactiplantibacillus argentoratensis DSM 16365]|nr:cell surface protein precursor [Lactiplantibacillus argentoratensis DSM 16365]